MPDDPQGQPSFFHDLRRSLAAWRRFPWLPGVAILLLAGGSSTLWWLSFPVLLFTAGWVGTERIVYLRAFRGLPLRVSELRQLTGAFVVRFALLGLVLAVPFGLYFAIVVNEVRSEAQLSTALVVFAIILVVLDMALTFVTPALAFSTRRVGAALAHGLRQLGVGWPRSAWYILVPPLAVLVLGQVLMPHLAEGTWLYMGITVTGALLNLWFKGATAAFYLRRHVVGDNGAAFSSYAVLPEPWGRSEGTSS